MQRYWTCPNRHLNETCIELDAINDVTLECGTCNAGIRVQVEDVV
ncbi:hypothetical protein [Halorussus sp. AFM4]